MYVQKEPVRGYNEYLNLNEGEGIKAMMDVGLLVMEAGDTYSFHETEKEMAWIMFEGKAKVQHDGKTVEMDRPNPFDYNPYCLHLCAGDSCTITAHDSSVFYVQKTMNDRKFEAKMYLPEDTDTWARGVDELQGTTRRNVRTCFDYENAPYSNMVLGEVVNLPGKWSSYPPHWHPQPEVYFFRFDKPIGYGAGWINGEVTEIKHNGLAVITEKPHPMVACPGYALCYTWGIRHLPGNPWEKTRIDDETHKWMLDPNAKIWDGESLDTLK